MTTLIRNLLGNGAKEAELTEEMRAVLRDVRTERSHCEALVKSARASITRIQELGEPIEQATTAMDSVTERLAALEQRLASFERLAAQFQSLDDRAERLSQGQRQSEVRITHSGEEAERISSLLDDLTAKVDHALELRGSIDTFLEVETPFRHLRTEAEELRAHMSGATERLARLQEQQDRFMEAHKSGLLRIDATERRHEDLARSVQDAEGRLAAVDQALRGMADVPQVMDETRRRLETLKSLGDYAAQKTAALESQRTAVERALARADSLDQAMRQVDAGMQQQQENARSLNVIKEQINGLQSVYDVVVQRSRDIEAVQREHDDQVAAIRSDLAKARAEVQKSVEALEFEQRGFESVSQRVSDLRNLLSELEGRFAGLSQSAQTVESLRSQTDALAQQLGVLTVEAADLDAVGERLKRVRRDLDRLAATSEGAGEQLARINEAQPALEAALHDLQQLQGAHALVKDTLEQTNVAACEIARVRQEQSETRSWLTEVKDSLTQLAAQTTELSKMAPTVEFVQGQLQRVSDSMAAVEARRDFVEEMHRRLAELGAVGATLDDRSRDLQTRMEAAEQRFVGLAAHAEETERVAGAVATISASLEHAEHATAELMKNIAGAEARCESVDVLAERTRALRQEVDQRQHALDEAARQLERVSELRHDAAASAQELEERTKRLTSALAAADQQAGQVEALTAQIEERAAGLRFVDKRVGEFEDRLAEWEQVEQEVVRSLEQIAARQTTVEALQADLERMFSVAERTAADVRAINAATREIEQSRAVLDAVTSQLRDAGQLANALDERKRQMTQAESRLAQAEALLIDIRSSMGVLQGQKVIVDQAVEKAGSLQFLLKQAELMIETLREERAVATRIHAALSASHADQDAAAESEAAD